MDKLIPEASERPHGRDSGQHCLDLGLGRVRTQCCLLVRLSRDGSAVQENHEARGGLGSSLQEVGVKLRD